MSEAVAIGIDVGGTKMLAVSIDADGRIVERRRLTSPRADTAGLVGAVRDAAGELGSGLPVGIGVAGTVSREGALRYSPNLDLREVPLQQMISSELGVRVTVRNDATVALYGEVRAGAAKGSRDVILLTLGTGVGGAILADGTLIEGAGGLGGELGHIIVDDGGRLCPCGSRGCLEAYASGSAVGLRARERLAAEDVASTLRGLDDVDGKQVTLAARDGDGFAMEVLEEAGYWLGVGVTSLVNVVDPEIVVIGGGAATLSAPILIPVATKMMTERVIGSAYRDIPTIVPADLADDAGVIGAAMIVYDEGSTVPA
jgi:glucokinase